MIVNSEKGNRLFNEIKRYCTIDDSRDFNYAVRGNRNLKTPQLQPDNYDQFWQRYLNGETLEELQSDFYPGIKHHKRTAMQKIKYYIKLTLSTLGVFKIK